ncbi:helix-turn-helix domain-containing protein [Flavihumibacter profundi]|uniref:helix-turn-helix domain-containing protein n=1 Tax=Flavihumibacter profundi TaxID=2716883 RepID=UPI001CC79749|nr:AraC family transcriptional regulator [Flavihumibacter profundi]MBZ5859075.1 helix-turn-helix transcriptional regulator [Flavihumibacter profundi]
MQKQVTYYETLVESFHNSNVIEPNSPHLDILKFEDIPHLLQDNTGNPFRLNAFVVGFVTDGGFNLNISNKEYVVEKNSLYFTSPWHIRQYAQVKDWKGYILFFTPDFIFQYPQGEYIFREFRFFHTENGMLVHPNENSAEMLVSQFEKMYQLLRSNHPEKMKMLFHYINIFLYECKSAFSADNPQGGATKDTTLNNFLYSLNNYFIELNKGNMEKALTLKYVANEMHLHPTYLSNLLKVQTGKTAAQLVRERLILEAQSLLRNTDMTVAEVAYYLHFKDNSNFAKFFRHQVGKSPSEYRDQALQNGK